MPLSLAFWILILFWLLSSFYVGWSTPAPGRFGVLGGSLLLFLLILVIGLKIFGGPTTSG